MSEYYESIMGETKRMPPKPSREGLIARLIELKEGDPEDHHQEADMLLLAYIDDAEITKAFRELERWYA